MLLKNLQNLSFVTFKDCFKDFIFSIDHTFSLTLNQSFDRYISFEDNFAAVSLLVKWSWLVAGLLLLLYGLVFGVFISYLYFLARGHFLRVACTHYK
jgi:hypothetical protein